MQPQTPKQPDQTTSNNPQQTQQPTGQGQDSNGYFANSNGAQVQYVMQAESLKGVKGWLMFFVVVFALMGIGFISTFFDAFASSGDSTAESVVNIIFGIPLAAGALASVVLISMQKKLGKLVAMGTLAVAALYGLIDVFVNESEDETAVKIGSAITGLVLYGLLILYFVVSKRVKETLVN